MVIPRDWDTQNKDAPNIYDTAVNRSDLEGERGINPEGLHDLLDSIIKDARTIQEMLLEPAQSDTNNIEDSSTTEKQPAAPGEDAAHQTPLSDRSSSGAHQDGNSIEKQLQPGSNGGQRTPQLRRSQRVHVPKASTETVETTRTPNSRPRTNTVVLSRKHGNSHAILLVQPQLQNPPEVMRLRQDQMKENLVQTLEDNHRRERRPYTKYYIEDLQPLKLEQSQINDKHLLQHNFTKTSTGLFISHKPGSKTLFNPSHFKWNGLIPTQENIKEIFNTLCQKPPKGEQCPYYIGPVEPIKGILGANFEPLVYAGHRLCRRNRGDLEGVNTVYLYISDGKNTPAPLHLEDAELGSVNLVREGAPKLWLIIDEQWAEELEEKLFDLHGIKKTCSQAVRHLSTFVTPEQLDDWGIPYYLDCCEAGQMIETKPGSYHQVINMGHNIAESVNIEFDDAPDMPSDTEYQWCQDTCGATDTLSKATFELSCSVIEHVCSGKTLDRGIIEDTLSSSALEANHVDTLRRALLCPGFTLALCEKARLVQMLAQCYKPTATVTECPKETDKIMFQIIQYFSTRKESVRLTDRIHLTRLDSMCLEWEETLRLESLHSPREDYTTPALRKLTQGLDLSRYEIDKLKSYREYGATLNKMCDLLGSTVLTALPCQSISANELVLPFSTDLQRKIKPSDYHKLSRKQLDFFLKFLPEIFPDALKSITNISIPKNDWQIFTQESFDLLPRPKRLKYS